MTQQVVVIGAGVGGLTAAALLVKAGLKVTVLEQQTYPGGSAGTFFHKGYRFDAGATLAGGLTGSGPHARIAELLGLQWDTRPVDPAWVVHVGGQAITQWASQDAWQAEAQRAFPEGEAFWARQSQLAEAAWRISSRPFPFPPTQLGDILPLVSSLDMHVLQAVPFALSKMADLLPKNASLALRTFVDAQLLISAQTTSAHANALYGSAALDLPRRGVSAPTGGMGGISRTMVDWIREHGGEVIFRQSVDRLTLTNQQVRMVHTRQGLSLPADAVIANLTPWSLAAMLGDQAPSALTREVRRRPETWGAFMLYLGVDTSQLPLGMVDHHQIIARPGQPLGETNSVFLSLSPGWDDSRAPTGMRAATVSTHTVIAPWWNLKEIDPQAYADRKAEYAEKVLDTIESALPGFRSAIVLNLPATPLTFHTYTLRSRGMVGGLPQTSLLAARSPRTGIGNLLMVGDSIFPGQSTAGVTLGAIRVAADMLRLVRR